MYIRRSWPWINGWPILHNFGENLEGDVNLCYLIFAMNYYGTQ